MTSSSLFFISITLLVLILTVESVYNVYLHDDGNNGDEHCCLARVRENLCLATPITRSLIQVDKQCHRFDRPKHRRFGGKKRNDHYLNKITRRLDIKSSQEIGDKILLELKTPLKTNMVRNDLICLKSTNKNINLEKCHLELADELDNDMDDDDDNDDDDHMPHRRHKHHGHRRRHHIDRKKRVVTKTDEEEEDNEVVDNNTETDDDKAEQETHRIELDQPVRIREGHGLSIRHTYNLSLTHIRSTNRHQQQCLSWYRKQTRKLRRNPTKHQKSCIRLNDHNEKCINQLVHNTFSDIETDQHSQIVSFAIGSKLYCKDQAGSNKFIGIHHHDEICFHPHNQINIEQKFTDTAGLSNMHKNTDVLQFIANHKKYTDEFEHDCHDKGTLVEVDAQDNELQSKTNAKKSKRD